MKRVYSEDWSHTDDDESNAFKDAMLDNVDHQNDPEVGIFWFDPNADELFGIKSDPADDVQYKDSILFNGKRVKTCRKLHYALWEKEYHRGKDLRFRGDYTKVPRGRVFYVENTGFVVCVGHWIRQYPQVEDYITDEFNLPESTQFKIDSHWDLGHGWSDKLM